MILRMQGLMGYADGNIRPSLKSYSFLPQNKTRLVIPTLTPAEQVPSSVSNPFDTEPFSKRPVTQSTPTISGTRGPYHIS